MRLFLRKAALILATGSLVFFLSCERHEVGELPDEHGHQKKAHADDQESKAKQPEATTNQSHTSQPPEPAAPQHSHTATSPGPDAPAHSHPSTSPEPRNSPANFFPDKPKP